MNPPAFIVVHLIPLDQIPGARIVYAVIEVSSAVIMYIIVDQFVIIAPQDAVLVTVFNLVV